MAQSRDSQLAELRLASDWDNLLMPTALVTNSTLKSSLTGIDVQELRSEAALATADPALRHTSCWTSDVRAQQQFNAVAAPGILLGGPLELLANWGVPGRLRAAHWPANTAVFISAVWRYSSHPRFREVRH